MGTIYDTFVKGMGSIRPAQCRDLNSLIEALAPLPPSNIGSAIVATFALVVSPDKDVLCR